VTFCQLVPMRSIPFEVVCLLGMNDGDFPRPSAPISFERSAPHGKPQPGDRSARDDDRHMFLEAILCARSKLYVSYVGRGLGDDRVRPPSVVVSELIDALDRGFYPAGSIEADPAQRRKELLARVGTEHRLHAFSPRYFDRSDRRLYSYSAQACAAAVVRAVDEDVAAPAVLAELRLSDEPRPEVDVEALVRWVSRPLQCFAEQRLGLYLREEDPPPPDREPLALVRLERWKVGTELLAMRLRGVELARALPALRAAGGVPDGAHGAMLLDQLVVSVEPLVARTLAARGGALLAPVLVSLEHGSVHIRGVLHDLYPGGHVVTTFSKTGPRAEHAWFIRSVVLGCQLAARGVPAAVSSLVCSLPVGKDDDASGAAVTYTLAPLQDPGAVLGDLLDLVQQARRMPLPFERGCSWAYAEARVEGAGRAEAIGAARKAWEQSHKQGYLDLHVERFFPTFDALVAPRDLDFVSVAERTYLPYLRARVAS
jgi:exodeoxyribonuclease V gamma subunit